MAEFPACLRLLGIFRIGLGKKADFYLLTRGDIKKFPMALIPSIAALLSDLLPLVAYLLS